MYKCQLLEVEDFDDILDLISENALHVGSCFYISDLRKICVMTERDYRQRIAEIIKVRKVKVKKRKPWQKRQCFFSEDHSCFYSAPCGKSEGMS